MLTLSVGIRDDESDTTHATCSSKEETHITNDPDKEDIHNMKEQYMLRNKRQRKPEEQSRMDNPEKLETYGTQNTDEDKQS